VRIPYSRDLVAHHLNTYRFKRGIYLEFDQMPGAFLYT